MKTKFILLHSLYRIHFNIFYTITEKLVEKGQMWETFMWHYRPWKPIVDGKFLPRHNEENEKESLTAFLPEHPNKLLKNGEFNKVCFR